MTNEMTNIEILWNLITTVEVRFLFCLIFGILFAYEWDTLALGAKYHKAVKRERRVWGVLLLGCVIGMVTVFI
jgi:hypothetical protein